MQKTVIVIFNLLLFMSLVMSPGTDEVKSVTKKIKELKLAKKQKLLKSKKSLQ